MAAYLFNSFTKRQMGDYPVDFASDDIYIAVTSVQPTVTWEDFADVTNEVSGTGYTTGGAQSTVASSTLSSSTLTVTLGAVTWSENAAGFSTGAYYIIYHNTGTDSTSTLIGWDEAGGSVGNTTSDLVYTPGTITVSTSDNVFYSFLETANEAAPIDFADDTIKVALIDDTTAPVLGTHDYWNDLSANEVSGTNYTADGETLTVTDNSANGIAIYDIADVTWSQSATGFSDARYAIFYKDTDTESTSQLIGFYDFGADQGNTVRALKISMPNGFFKNSKAA